MPLRMAICVMLTMAGVLLFVEDAEAVTIDAGLSAALAEKGEGRVPVLMIFDPSDPGLPVDLGGAQLLAALKTRAETIQATALSVLRDPLKARDVDRVRSLYLAGAITFEGTADVVAALAELPLKATLFHDRTHDLARAERPVLSRPPEPFDTAVADTAWSLTYINAPRVWSELGHTGAGVVVGHIDSGVWLTHSDLAGRLWANPGETAGNGLDDDGNGYIDDLNGWDFGDGDADPNDDSATGGHGTHTAGTVAGDGTGGVRTGVAPGAQLMVAKVWKADGSGGSLGMIWAAEQYCVENGARLLTLSVGFSGDLSELFLAADRINCANIRDTGVTIFNVAGNEHFVYEPPLELALTARVPAPWNELQVPYSSTGGAITVGGTGYQTDLPYAFSSHGPARWDHVAPWHDWPYDPGSGLIKPDVVMPGAGVNSTVRYGGYSGNTWSGTSMACPHAAGVAALMLERNPSLSPAGIDSLMELNAIDLGSPGKDNEFGAGRLDAFTVVSAVPITLSPDLIAIGTLPDPLGDSVLDPGTQPGIAFKLLNVSPAAAATGVTASLAVVANPLVTVIDAQADFPDLAAAGGEADNTADVFQLDIAPDAPHGYEFTLLLSVETAGGFRRTFDIPWFVGLPDWRTHDMGGVYLTVTDQGILGYMSQTGDAGDGFGYRDGASNLFLGSFWAGTDADYVCARDYDRQGTEVYEWIVSSPTPNGRVRDLGAVGADQTFQAVFTDGGHPVPRGLVVEQLSMVFAATANQSFAILEYELTNTGDEPLLNLYAGLYCDFDVIDTGGDSGGTDILRNLVYLYEGEGPYYGIVVLKGDPVTNVTLVNNPQYVYPTISIDDASRMDLLRGDVSVATTPAPDDWSVLAATRVHLAGGGGREKVAYAMVRGSTLEELLLNTDAALSAYNPVAKLDAATPVKVVHLAQNRPNPFNPETDIEFSVRESGRVRIAVFDVAGRHVRTLLDANRGPGSHSVTWDGRTDTGERAPSGTYVCRLLTGAFLESRKMLLVK